MPPSATSILLRRSAALSSLGKRMPMPCVRLAEERAGVIQATLPAMGVALRVVRQGDEHVDVIAQVVFARAGNEDAAFGKDGDVGSVESGFFLDGQLDDAGAGRVEGSGNGAHEM